MGNQSIRTSYRQGKVIALWTTFLLAMLFHIQLALMPLFHAMSVAESHTHPYASVDAIWG